MRRESTTMPTCQLRDAVSPTLWGVWMLSLLGVEFEFGPFGQWMRLALSGVRNARSHSNRERKDL